MIFSEYPSPSLDARDQDGKYNPLLSGEWWETATSENVDKAVSLGYSVHACDNSNEAAPLHHAAGNSKIPAAVKTLLEHGADVEVCNSHDDTPLHYAAARNKTPTVVELLLNKGADIKAKNKEGITPLLVAIELNIPAIIDMFLDRSEHATLQHEISRALRLARANRFLQGTDTLKRLERIFEESN